MAAMIARVWRGAAATPANADAYEDHVRTRVLPALGAIAGYRGARVLRRGLEFVVITQWESMDAVRRFAGDEPEAAVVEPEARAVLSEFEEVVRHYDVVAQ
jgi:heme-degrading monooxygenase HmoA